jgi:SAM-dependent methyltransferase
MTHVITIKASSAPIPIASAAPKGLPVPAVAPPVQVAVAALRGTEYGTNGIEAYAKFAHGSDMSCFLDPFIAKGLDKQNGKKVLDAGCGAAPWSIYAAQRGATVDAIDIQPGMIVAANKAIVQANLADKVTAVVGDGTALPYQDNSFDHAISINVGCNLPKQIFAQHFQQLGKAINLGGTIDVAAPDSLDVVFTDGSSSEAVVGAHIAEVLKALPNNPTPAQIQEKLGALKEITSATFTIVENRLVLVTDQTKLVSGQNIWRKLAAVTIPNHYYSDADYMAAFKAANLTLAKVDRRVFATEMERTAFNLDKAVHPKLGSTYSKHAPFVVYHVEKRVLKCDDCNLQ